MYNDVQTTNLSKTELFPLNTRSVDLLPDPSQSVRSWRDFDNYYSLSVASFPRTLHSSLILAKIDQRSR